MYLVDVGVESAQYYQIIYFTVIDLPGRQHLTVTSISFAIAIHIRPHHIASHNPIEYVVNAIIISILFRTCLFSTSFRFEFVIRKLNYGKITTLKTQINCNKLLQSDNVVIACICCCFLCIL